MLERQRINGAVVAGLLIGIPVIEARATVMEFDREGLTRMQPSVNYLQRAKMLARGAEAQARAGDNGVLDTGWLAENKVAQDAPIETAVMTTRLSSKPLDSREHVVAEPPEARPALSQLPAAQVSVARYLPIGALQDALPDDQADGVGPEETLPEPEDLIIETGTGTLKPSLDALAQTIPAEAITVVVANPIASNMDDDEALDSFPHLADDPLAQLAAEIALTENVPPALFLALIEAESGFDIDAISSQGAIGLTQLMPGTAEELGVDPEDPVQNLTGGARYLAAQFKRFGAWDLALAAYNAGPTRVARLGAVPDYAETRGFIARVLKGAAQSPVRLANLN